MIKNFLNVFFFSKNAQCLRAGGFCDFSQMQQLKVTSMAVFNLNKYYVNTVLMGRLLTCSLSAPVSGQQSELYSSPVAAYTESSLVQLSCSMSALYGTTDLYGTKEAIETVKVC